MSTKFLGFFLSSRTLTFCSSFVQCKYILTMTLYYNHQLLVIESSWNVSKCPILVCLWLIKSICQLPYHNSITHVLSKYKGPTRRFCGRPKKSNNKKKLKKNQNIFLEANNFHTTRSSLTYSLEPKRNCSK